MQINKSFWKVLLAASACVAVVLIILKAAYLHHKTYEKLVISNNERQLLMTARATAKRIEDFFETYQRDLKILSLNPQVQELAYKGIKETVPGHGYCILKTFYEEHASEVDALTLLDAKGVMLHRHPFIAERLGRDHMDKPGVASVIRTHKPFVSGLFINNLGNPAISISMPVFYRGNFVGIIRWMVQMDTVYRRFLKSIESGGDRCAWLVDSKGIAMAHKEKQRIGQNFFGHILQGSLDEKCSPIQRILADFAQGKEGTGFFTCPEEGRRIVAYAPVYVGNRVWSAGLCQGYSEVAQPILEHARNTLAASGVILLSFLAGGLVFLRSQKKKRNLRRRQNIIDSLPAQRKNCEKARKNFQV